MDKTAEYAVARRVSVDRFVGFVLRYRFLVIVACLLASAVLAIGIKNLAFSTNYRVFFSERNQYLTAFNEFEGLYQKEDNVLIVIAPDRGDVFTPGILAAIRGLTEASWKLPYTVRVDSVTNFQHSEAQGDDIAVRSLVDDSTTIAPAAAERARRIALSEPLLAGRLVARDGRATAVNISLALPGQDDAEVTRTMEAVRALVDSFRTELKGVRVAVTGDVPLNNAFVEAAIIDMRSLFPMIYVVVFLGIMLLFPSAGASVGSITVIGLSTLAAVGTVGWSGMLLNPVSAAAPLIITTVATGDCIHILTTISHRLKENMTKEQAILDSLRVNFFPVFLTSLTTAIGFLSLNASDAPPFRDLGNIAAIGVGIAWIFSITLLPALLAILPIGRTPLLDRIGPFERRLAEFVIAYPRRILVTLGLATAVLIAAIPRIELYDQFVEYFSRSLTFRTDTDFAAERLSGMYYLEFSVPAGAEGTINEPDYLARLDRFATWLRSQPEVVHVQAWPDTMKRLNKNMHGDDADAHVLPERRELAAQYLLLFEMSLPQGLDLRNQITIDRSATRVTATLRNITTRQSKELKSRADAWLHQNIPSARDAEATGPIVMFSFISENNIRSMLKGTAIALVLIAFCLFLTLRSVRFGLLSLIPNATPALMAFGTWALLYGKVGLSASVISAITLGIIVDNTVHFLSKYRLARRTLGASSADSVRNTFAVVGPALWSGSIILACGFAVLAFSSFEVNATLGILSSITIFFALITDLLLLPALLMTFDI